MKQKESARKRGMFATALEALLRDERTMRAVFGIGSEKFAELARQMEQLWRSKLQKRPNRQRAPGAGQKGKISSGMRKVAFILFYMKAYPTFDVLSTIAGLDRSKCCRWVHKLLPLMEEILRRKHALPKRQIRGLEEFAAAFPGAREVIINGIETEWHQACES